MENVEIYKVKKLENMKDIVVDVPGSKSITNRALLLAALSTGRVELKGALFSDDSRHFLSSLQSLGYDVDIDEGKKQVAVVGTAGEIPLKEGTVNVGSAGTAARFLTAMLGLSGGHYTIEASEQMKKRPMKPLFIALESLGVKFRFLEEAYHLPVETMGFEYNGINEVTLDTDESTQYLSAMLMTGVMLRDGINIKVTGSRKTGSYVDITKKMMSEFGCELSYDNETYHIAGGSKYNRDNFAYQIEPDVSGACYFYGIGAIMGISVKVRYVHRDSMQGDIRFVDALEDMGCQVRDTEDGIEITGPKNGKLKALDIDMKTFSDQALTMAAISLFADGVTKIRNIEHIRKQESDRLSVIATELGRMGIKCDEEKDSITIYPSDIKPCQIETYDDHRVAMAFTLVGIKNGGIEIKNPMCCRKTFENYFDIIDELMR